MNLVIVPGYYWLSRILRQQCKDGNHKWILVVILSWEKHIWISGTPRKLEFVRQTIRDNIALQRESSEYFQSFAPAFSWVLISAYGQTTNTWQKDHQKEAGIIIPGAHTMTETVLVSISQNGNISSYICINWSFQKSTTLEVRSVSSQKKLFYSQLTHFKNMPQKDNTSDLTASQNKVPNYLK